MMRRSGLLGGTFGLHTTAHHVGVTCAKDNPVFQDLLRRGFRWAVNE